jgi:hypothetical protein
LTRKNKKYVFALFSMILAFGTVTPAFATETKQENPRRSQWTVEQTRLDESTPIEPRINHTQQFSSNHPVFANILPEKAEYAADRVIVKYKSKPDSTLSKSLSSQIVGASQLPVTNAEMLNLSAGASVSSVINELLKDPNVLYAEPDFKVYSTINPQTFRPLEAAEKASSYSATASPSLPNDPLFNEQWGLHNTGQVLNEGTVPGGKPDIDMDLPEAWEITKGSKDVIVAVIGNGVKIDIPDLVGQIWENKKETPNDNIDNDKNGLIDDVNGWDFAYGDNSLFDTIDGLNDSYGTVTAGHIAASMNNKEGIAGVAPNVTIMPLKVISKDGGYYTDVVKGIHYAEEQGAKIASLGILYGFRSKLVEDAINSSNMLFVAAAGDKYDAILNTDVTPLYPAAYPSQNMLSVTGVNILGDLSLGAAIGQISVDVAAPSELIISTVADVNAGYAAEIDNKTYKYKAYYHGIGFEDVPNKDERQDMFNRAMNFLKPSAKPKILLVQDSLRSYSDGGGIGPFANANDPSMKIYEELLTTAGYTYDVETTADETFDGPSLSRLQEYDIVIWFTGYLATRNGHNLITNKDQINLSSYLNGGGHLMLTGQDAIDQIPTSSFVQNVLGLTLVKEGGYIFKTWGVPGTIYEGKDYKLMDFSLFYDTVISNKPEMTKINLRNNNGKYFYSQGTSNAAAYATGVAALVLSQNPGMSAQEIKQRVVNSGKSQPSLKTNTVSGKLISAYRALWNKDIPGMSLLDSSISNRLDKVNDPNHVYSIEMHAGEEVTFSLTGSKGSDFDLILYDSSATTVASKDGALAYSETPGTSNESITYRATETGTYYINIFAYNGTGTYTLDVHYGNTSGLIEDNDPSLIYNGSWSTLKGSSNSNGSLKQLNGEGYVEFGFRGNVFEWIGTKDDKQGLAVVYIDELPMGYANLYSKTPLSRQSLFKYVLPNGHHNVRIERIGSSDQKGDINVDAFVFTNLVSPTHSSANYIGPWATRYGMKYADGVQTYTTIPDSSVEFTFIGTKATLWSTTGSNRGKVNIYIDGRSVTSEPIDLYSEKLQYQVPVFTSEDLANGVHKIKIVHAGEANAKSTDSIIAIDGLDVLNLN